MALRWSDAVVDPAKVREYLLASAHPVGRFKAAWFRTFGYREADWERLVQDLLESSAAGVVIVGERNAYGQKYQIRATLSTPSLRRCQIVAVWIVLEGERFPRFVTAYPART